MREATTDLDRRVEKAFKKQLLGRFCRVTFEDYFLTLKVFLHVMVKFTFCSKGKCKMEILKSFHYAKSNMIPLWENYPEQITKDMLNDLWVKIEEESKKSPGTLIEITLVNDDSGEKND
jgi:hypothetical protein